MVPVISGTVAGQTVDGGSTINPFSGVSISDANPYVHDTLTITLLDSNGNASDGNGTLQLSDGSANVEFSHVAAGVYVLADQTTPSENTVLDGLNSALPKLTFISSGAATVTFSLSDQSVDAINNSHTVTDNTTTVTSGGAGAAITSFVQDIAAPSDTSSDTAPAANTDVAAPVNTSGDTTAPADTSNPVTPDTATTSPNIHVTGRVGTGTTVDLSKNDGHLVIDHPGRFHGTVDLGSGDIDLKGLAAANSYSFKDDILSIFGGGKTLDKLHITGGADFSVEKTATGVSIYTADDTHHAAGTLLSNIT